MTGTKIQRTTKQEQIDKANQFMPNCQDCRIQKLVCATLFVSTLMSLAIAFVAVNMCMA